MTDLQKRETLKRMGVAGAVAAVATTPVLATLNPATVGLSAAVGAPPMQRGVSDLSISIIATTSVPGSSTAVFTNMTDEEIVVQHFLPGTIVFGDRRVDLNAVPGAPLLRIAPHGVVSMPVQVNRIDTQAMMEYVWADDAVSAISEHTEVVTLGAFVADHRLIVYPVPALSIPA